MKVRFIRYMGYMRSIMKEDCLNAIILRHTEAEFFKSLDLKNIINNFVGAKTIEEELCC